MGFEGGGERVEGVAEVGLLKVEGAGVGDGLVSVCCAVDCGSGVCGACFVDVCDVCLGVCCVVFDFVSCGDGVLDKCVGFSGVSYSGECAFGRVFCFFWCRCFG